MAKRPLGKNVFDAAADRISWTFDTFEKVYVSFSGGKDSTVMLHMVMDEAIKRGRRVGVLYIDFEAQYKLTIDHIRECYNIYKSNIDPFWVALPIALRNAVSVFEPKWTCWDPSQKEKWVRCPDASSIIDQKFFDFYKYDMEFEEFVPKFGHWYADGRLTACMVGIRTDESLNRFRTIMGKKSSFEGIPWTTYTGKTTYNVYPIYDWRTRDLWIYHQRTKKIYNKLYDRMYQAGLTIHQARICQPYGDDQRKGLWLFHVIEPETWGKVVSRVSGANSGALYASDSGNIQGVRYITKPDGHTWQSFAMMLLDTMPAITREHYKNKIAVFIKWWSDRGYHGGIPDELDKEIESKKKGPSWRRICKALLRNDYWCKGLSFTQHKSEAYRKYLKLMKKRRESWKII